MKQQQSRRRLGLRRSVGRLWHHFFFRESTLPPHQAIEGLDRRPSTTAIESYKMADSVDPVMTSSSTAAPSQAPSQPAAETPQPQTLPIRDSKSAKPTAQSDKGSSKPKDAGTAPATGGDVAGDQPLTPAQLKAKAKAEKAARRAKEKVDRESGGAGAAGGSAPGAGGQSRPPNTPKKDTAGGGASQKGVKGAPPRRGSGPVPQTGAAAEPKKKKEDKSVAVFGHLYGQQRRTTVNGAAKEVHPAILALGLQLRDYVVCGSSARCVATLLAFKRVSLLLRILSLGIWFILTF